MMRILNYFPSSKFRGWQDDRACVWVWSGGDSPLQVKELHLSMSSVMSRGRGSHEKCPTGFVQTFKSFYFLGQQ